MVELHEHRRLQRRGLQRHCLRRFELIQCPAIGSQCPGASACLWRCQHGVQLTRVSPTFPPQMSPLPARYPTTWPPFFDIFQIFLPPINSLCLCITFACFSMLLLVGVMRCNMYSHSIVQSSADTIIFSIHRVCFYRHPIYYASLST